MITEQQKNSFIENIRNRYKRKIPPLGISAAIAAAKGQCGNCTHAQFVNSNLNCLQKIDIIEMYIDRSPLDPEVNCKSFEIVPKK